MKSTVYRIDKFIVPESAREEFLSRVRETHRLLQTLPGFVTDVVAEKTAGNGAFNFVTIAEWESQEAVEAAKREIDALREKTHFNPQEMFGRLGIQADLASYRAIDV